jgi:hypothetical protein
MLYKELYILHFSLRVIKKRRMRWPERVAHMEAKKCAYRFVVGNHEGIKPHGNPGVVDRMN